MIEIFSSGEWKLVFTMTIYAVVVMTPIVLLGKLGGKKILLLIALCLLGSISSWIITAIFSDENIKDILLLNTDNTNRFLWASYSTTICSIVMLILSGIRNAVLYYKSKPNKAPKPTQ